MTRVIVTQIILFLLPFVIYGVYRLATEGTTGAAVASMGRASMVLVGIGGALMVAGFVAFALIGGTEEGVYVPAQYIDGKLIPGGFRPVDEVPEGATVGPAPGTVNEAGAPEAAGSGDGAGAADAAGTSIDAGTVDGAGTGAAADAAASGRAAD